MSDKSSSITIFIVYAIAVAFFSLQPGSGVNLDPYDKVAHFLTYGVFAGLAYRMNLSFRRFICVCGGITVYGGALEYASMAFGVKALNIVALLLYAIAMHYSRKLKEWMGTVTAKTWEIMCAESEAVSCFCSHKINEWSYVKCRFWGFIKFETLAVSGFAVSSAINFRLYKFFDPSKK